MKHKKSIRTISDTNRSFSCREKKEPKVLLYTHTIRLTDRQDNGRKNREELQINMTRVMRYILEK